MRRLSMALLLLQLPALAPAQVLTVDEVLIHAVDAATDRALAADPVEIALAFDSFEIPVPSESWRPAFADSADWIRDDALRSAYAFATVTVPRDTTLILEGMGYQSVWIEGAWRAGNIYGHTDRWESWQPRFDWSRLPVQLRRGENRLLFAGNRYGVLRARFFEPAAPMELNLRDLTLPDAVVGDFLDAWGAVPVINATGEVVTDALLRVRLAGAGLPLGGVAVTIPALPPWSVFKAPVPLRGTAPAQAGDWALTLSLERSGETLATGETALRVVESDANRRVTFVSELDGSVQYYGLLPARRGDDDQAPGLVLSLHGAAVEALNQSGSYAPLSWAHVVAPTNRRPFGFNWEDWGRVDALEALDHATALLAPAPDRVYLTGHSMGGHGAWHLAALFPDRFAAVGPSAGWISFWSYRPDREGGVADAPLAAMVHRATLPSRTLELAPNLAGLGVYVLHGADDEVVLVEEARAMRERLAGFHRDLDWHEQPGAGHWWDLSPAPGADCVAWPPMFDFFARHRRPAPDEVREVRFSTPGPGVNAWRYWACVARQERSFAMSEVALALDPLSGELSGTTANVALLGIDVDHVAADSLRVALDGDLLAVAVPDTGMLWLARDGTWQASGPPDPAFKGPHRAGGLREAFRHRVQLVYGTRGNADENAWALGKARYDAEHLWYQGNAAVEVLPDTLFDPAAEPDRNVVLYGNADTNAHWAELWGPDTSRRDGWSIPVGRTRIVVGDRALLDGNEGILAVRPRPGSDVASVGIVGGTSLAGCRLTDRRPYLAPGVAYPDITLLRLGDDGTVVEGAGFFAADWSLQGLEFVWAERP